MTRRFTRSETVRFLRLGKNRIKLHKWRKPRGRHSKIRRKRVGYPIQPGIGFKKSIENARKISMINNFDDIKMIGKGDKIIISSRVGARKKLELLKVISEKGFAMSSKTREKK